MDQDHSSRQARPVACGREPLVDAIAGFLSHGHIPAMSDIRASLERTIDEAGPAALDGLAARLAQAGVGWEYFPRDPLARRIHQVLAGPVLQREPDVSGLEHLAAVADQPLVIVANHLSYSDANVIDVLLQGAGQAAICDRLTVMAGPKVYSNIRRRFSSLCFGTIKTPQNSARSSDDAVMTTREVARAARRTIDLAHQRLRLGEALLVFPEGTRSRSGAMQQLLAGVARYFQPPAWVLPLALTGTESLFAIDQDTLVPVPLRVAIGRPLPAATLVAAAGGDRRLIMDAVGLAIAALVPARYRGVYGEGDRDGLAGARQLATDLSWS
jgi:1-acyl-sn-glycerol-3-phosphate acyltransferase